MGVPKWLTAIAALVRDARQGDTRAMILLISDAAAIVAIAAILVAIVLTVLGR